MFFRTDMAIERRELFKNANKIEHEINGIKSEEENVNDTKITRVIILNKEGEKALKRRIGSYITIDTSRINNISVEKEKEIIEVFSNELKNVLNKHVKKEDEILIVGLGNSNATPDSLGTRVVENIEITRHIKKYLPNAIDKSTRSISAIVPRSARYNWNRDD